ncbi:MAG: hypothetical protein ABL909_01365 [Sphingopyxis sp.]
MKLPTIAIAALTLIAASPDTGFDAIWQEHGAALEAQGVTRPMAHQAFIWTEGQYHLGICLPYISESDLAHWRLWWRNTPLESSDYGRAMLRAGNANYYEGVADGRRGGLTRQQCQRLLDNWQTDMKNAVSVEVKP